jgi:hypothetical protein
MTTGRTGRKADQLIVFDALRVLHHAHADAISWPVASTYSQAGERQLPADNQASLKWMLSKGRRQVLCGCCTMLMRTAST